MVDYLPAVDIVSGIRYGEFSPVEVVDACLDRIRDHDPELNCFITVLEDEARERAREAERAVENGKPLGPLHGVPVALKDAYAYKAGVRNTFGSRAMTDFVPERSAPLVDRLEEAGAIVVGKTNTPEFASKGETDNDLVGRTANPFDVTRSPSGSSGGSAAAVAAGLVPLAQGSDHAGSVRSPASACGLVGIFPSAGRVPQSFHPNAYKYDLPHIGSGPLARTVEDAALFLATISGAHPYEPFSLPDEPDFLGALDRSVTDLSIGHSPDFAGFIVDPRVKRIIDDALEDLDAEGAHVEQADPDIDDWERPHDSLMAGLEVLFASFAENLKTVHDIDLLARRDLVDPHVISRIEDGRERDALSYKRANVARTNLLRSLQDFFDEYDLLAVPTLAVPPWDADSGRPSTVDGQTIDTSHNLVLTWPINLTGHPAISVPAGLVEGLPVGLQLIGPRFGDELVIAAAAALERVRPWMDQYPF